ncbi:MAG: S-methyl-5'-thioadenosine phosphorylase [Pseudomonadota bacterium]
MTDEIDVTLGIIGGSGLYDLPGLDGTWETIESPWGTPSDQVLRGTIEGTKVVFMPRHRRGHQIPPSDIPFRANIDVMKRAGVTDLVSMSAVGSLKEALAPGMFVIVDQFIDRTFARAKSFFGEGCVAHVSMAHPVSEQLSGQVEAAAKATGVAHAMGGTYLAMEGPQFSSLAESQLYRQWGCDVIGMTNMPEAKLAREAEISYATVAMVTDYDSWHPDHGEVDITAIVKVMHENAEAARTLVATLAKAMPARRSPCPSGADRALEFAIITQPDHRDPALVAKLDAIAGRIL